MGRTTSFPTKNGLDIHKSMKYIKVIFFYMLHINWMKSGGKKPL